MTNLLIGCRVLFDNDKEYTVLYMDRDGDPVCLDTDDGSIHMIEMEFISLPPKTVAQIKKITSNLQEFKKANVEKVSRAELMDLD